MTQALILAFSHREKGLLPMRVSEANQNLCAHLPLPMGEGWGEGTPDGWTHS